MSFHCFHLLRDGYTTLTSAPLTRFTSVMPRCAFHHDEALSLAFGAGLGRGDFVFVQLGD